MKTAELCYLDGDHILYLGVVQSIQDNISASNLTVPIVTYSAENAFTLDISSKETFTIKFERANDSNDGNEVIDKTVPSGKRKMNNREWLTQLRKLINQWQAQHDGYLLVYNEDDDFKNHAPIKQKGYIQSISTTFKCGTPEVITGSIVFQSGSMRAKNSNANDATVPGFGDTIKFEDASISMTSSDQQKSYPLYIYNGGTGSTSEDALTCVSSYSMTYGPTEPFPSLSMTISKKRLASIAPDLVDDIVAGKNMITINACGRSTFVVTKCKTSSKNYNITAYALEEMYKGCTPGVDFSTYRSPQAIIREILVGCEIKIGSTSLRFRDDHVLIIGNKDIPVSWDDPVLFSSTDSCWQILSICVAYMGCTMWFCDGYAYIVQLTQIPDDISTEKISKHAHYFKNPIYLSVIDGIPSAQSERDFCNSVQGEATFDDDGVDALANSIEVSYMIKTSSGETSETVVTKSTGNIELSQKAFGVRGGSSLSMGLVSNSSVPQGIANKIPLMTLDAQSSVTFTLTETYDVVDGGKKVTYWRSYFTNISYVDKVVDFNSDMTLNNVSSFIVKDNMKVRLPQKLFLSKIVRKFPDFSSEYTFGCTTNVDFTQTTSKILGAIKK